MKFSDFLTYFTDTIFRRDVTEWRNPVMRWLVQQYRLLFYTARGLLEHGTIVRSAALTFYTLMSLVPILAVVFAVVKGFGLADGLIENLYGLFPETPTLSTTSSTSPKTPWHVRRAAWWPPWRWSCFSGP